MPHLILSYSSNVIEKDDLHTLFERCHVFLADRLPTNIEGCKSRAQGFDLFRVGHGERRNAFVHVDLKIMPGRDDLVKGEVGEGVMEILLEHFVQSRKELNLQLTLDITELTNYFKVS